MNHGLRSVFGLALLLSLAGCIEKTQQVTLNPDGSGKTEFDMLVVATPGLPFGATSQPAAAPSPTEQLKSAVLSMLQKSQGFDAWKDIKFDLAKDGRFHITGIGYFQDFNHRQMQVGDFSTKTTERWSANPDGGMELALDQANQQKKAKPAAAAVPLTDADVAAKIAQTKMQWQQMKPMMASLLATMRDDPALAQRVREAVWQREAERLAAGQRRFG